MISQKITTRDLVFINYTLYKRKALQWHLDKRTEKQSCQVVLKGLSLYSIAGVHCIWKLRVMGFSGIANQFLHVVRAISLQVFGSIKESHTFFYSSTWFSCWKFLLLWLNLKLSSLLPHTRKSNKKSWACNWLLQQLETVSSTFRQF